MSILFLYKYLFWPSSPEPCYSSQGQLISLTKCSSYTQITCKRYPGIIIYIRYLSILTNLTLLKVPICIQSHSQSELCWQKITYPKYFLRFKATYIDNFARQYSFFAERLLLIGDLVLRSILLNLLLQELLENSIDAGATKETRLLIQKILIRNALLTYADQLFLSIFRNTFSISVQKYSYFDITSKLDQLFYCKYV